MGIYEKVEEYFDNCTQWHGTPHRLPLLTVTGNTHPNSYCNTRHVDNILGDVRLDLTTEAFQSGPIHVSVVRDPAGNKGDFFHMEDSDPRDSNRKCPKYFSEEP